MPEHVYLSRKPNDGSAMLELSSGAIWVQQINHGLCVMSRTRVVLITQCKMCTIKYIDLSKIVEYLLYLKDCGIGSTPCSPEKKSSIALQ